MPNTTEIENKNKEKLTTDAIFKALIRRPFSIEEGEKEYEQTFFLITNIETGEITDVAPRAVINQPNITTITVCAVSEVKSGKITQLSIPFFPDDVSESAKMAVNNTVQAFNASI